MKIWDDDLARQLEVVRRELDDLADRRFRQSEFTAEQDERYRRLTARERALLAARYG